MTASGRGAAGFVAAFFVVASLSCSEEAEPGAATFFGGSWEGVLSISSGGTSEASGSGLTLAQSGDSVTGTLWTTAGSAALLGNVDGGNLSFTLDFAGSCGTNVAGSGTVESLADRDRLHLRFQGSSTCEGVLAGSGTLDRMRCAPPTSACAGAYPAHPFPFCADLASDPWNCGFCGYRCDGSLQICAGGQCAVPACAGPVPLEAPRALFAADTLWSLVLGDADGDGAQDAIASGAMVPPTGLESVIVVLRNDGHGALSRRTVTSLASLFPGDPPYVASALATGDLDGDGALDIAAYVGALPYPYTLTTEGEVLTLLGNRDGSFRAGQRLPTGADESLMYLGTRVIAVADLDGDGVDDVAARSGNARAVQVRLGRRDGALGTKVEYALAEAVGAIAIADVDADGLLDLVIASEGSYSGAVFNRVMSVLLGNGDGSFRPPIESPGAPSPQDMAVADVDEDGVADLVVVGWWSWASHEVPDVSVSLGNGDGSFRPPIAIEQEPWSFAWSLAVADLDGDGHVDLAVGDDVRGLELFRGMGDGSFLPFEKPVPGGAGLVAVADLDGDGLIDVLVGDEGGREDLAVYRACAR